MFKLVKVILISTSLPGFSLEVQSAPSLLKIDQNQKFKTRDKYIKAAHELIEHDLSLDEVRFTILNAALNNKNVKWILEQDGDTYLILRWDYGEEVIYSKVEYDNQFIQLKYFDASKDFTCLKNIEGICYLNKNSDYYGYMKKLRTAIANLL